MAVPRGWRAAFAPIGALSLITLVIVLAHSAVAGEASIAAREASMATGTGSAAAPATSTAGAIKAVAFVRDTVPHTTSSQSYVDLPGATYLATVPAATKGLLLARFSAESACYDGNGRCSVRILIGGVEGVPKTGKDFAFDSSDQQTESVSSSESHAMERARGNLNPGMYEVQVQWAAVQCRTCISPPTFRIDDWTLTVERAEQ